MGEVTFGMHRVNTRAFNSGFCRHSNGIGTAGGNRLIIFLLAIYFVPTSGTPAFDRQVSDNAAASLLAVRAGAVIIGLISGRIDLSATAGLYIATQLR